MKIHYVLILSALTATGMWAAFRQGGAADGRIGDPVPVDRPMPSTKMRETAESANREERAESSATDDRADEELSEDEKREAAEESQVEAFDGLADKWTEPAADKVTIAEVHGFHDAFAILPKARQEECLRRALNLIPDENIMLIAGILLDKRVDRELIEIAFHDILNRDEEVKNPILDLIYKDKSHPCWSDAAWIKDAVGEEEP